MRVVGLGPRVVGHVRVKALAALGAAVLGVNEFDIAGPPVNQIAHVVQQSGAGAMSRTRPAALGTREMWIVATASNDLRLGQIFWMRDAFGGVRNVLPGTRHGDALLGQVPSARNLRHLPAGVMVNFPAMMLKTPKIYANRARKSTCTARADGWVACPDRQLQGRVSSGTRHAGQVSSKRQQPNARCQL
jgi:hypothetical protein